MKHPVLVKPAAPAPFVELDYGDALIRARRDAKFRNNIDLLIVAENDGLQPPARAEMRMSFAEFKEFVLMCEGLFDEESPST